MGKATSAKRIAARKEAILEGLAMGHSYAQSCRDASCPDSSAHRYRQLDSEFAEEVNRLLASPEHSARIAVSQGAAPSELSAKEKFLFYFEGSKDRAYSCIRSGIQPTELDRYIDQESDDYDFDFANALSQQVRANEMRLEDKAMRKALVSGESSMIRFLMGGAKGQQKISAAGDVFIVNPGAEDSARKMIRDRFSDESA